MKYAALYLCILFTSTSCFRADAPYYKHMAEVRGSFIRDVAKPHGLIPFAVGEGLNRGQVTQIILSLQTAGLYTVPEARILIVAFAEKMIQMMNASEGLRPHLCNYPADLRNVDLTIRFAPNMQEHYDPPYLAIVSVLEGNVDYDYWGSERSYEAAHHEHYEEALQWVKENAPHVLDWL